MAVAQRRRNMLQRAEVKCGPYPRSRGLGIGCLNIHDRQGSHFGWKPNIGTCGRRCSRPALASNHLALPGRVLAVRVIVRDAAARRDPVVQSRRQTRVVPRAKRATFAAEVGVAAEDPVTALDAQR